MSNKVSLFMGILLAVFAVLYFRTCQSKPPDHSADKKSVDSMVEKAFRDSIIIFKKIDSVNRTVLVLQKQKDSLTKLLTTSKSDLKSKDNDISGLIDEINKAEGADNVAAALIACDSLKSLYPATKALAVRYVHENDSLTTLNGQIISSKDTIIAHIYTLFTTSNSSLFETSRLYSNLTADYKKVVKSANKRFGIGPEITAGVVGGKIAVVPGIGIHYSLIKF